LLRLVRLSEEGEGRCAALAAGSGLLRDLYQTVVTADQQQVVLSAAQANKGL
jgi:hypothetical protein